MIVYVVAIGILSILGLGISVYQWFKLPEIIDGYAQRVAEGLRAHVDEEFKPMKNAVSRSMTQKSVAGVDARQVKAMNRRLGEDVINLQSPEVKVLLEMFPNAAAYVKENPDLIMELLPRIQALQGNEGFKLTDLLGGSPPSSSRSSSHPFGMREE